VEHATSGPVVVLSPHLDDAVLSAWSVITGVRDVVVVNVFAGVPDPEPVPRWDRLAGASDSRAHMRARLDEDRVALELAGRSATYLPFLDRQYRTGDPESGELARVIGDTTPAASMLYAPAGVGGHADHVLVRDAAVDLSRRMRLPLRLYAELPYAARFGWPSWVSGAPADPCAVVDVDWDLALNSASVPRSALCPHVHQLDDTQMSAKLAAMKRYRTQFSLLNQGPIGLLEHPLVLSREVAWWVEEDRP
jgi:LmbE family N-acetylglucosaminyl deacetylase